MIETLVAVFLAWFAFEVVSLFRPDAPTEYQPHLSIRKARVVLKGFSDV